MLVAGGLGLLPLRSVIYQVLAQRRRFGQVSLLYGARNPADLVFLREFAQWRGRFDITVEVTVNAGDGSWQGPVDSSQYSLQPLRVSGSSTPENPNPFQR